MQEQLGASLEIMAGLWSPSFLFWIKPEETLFESQTVNTNSATTAFHSFDETHDCTLKRHENMQRTVLKQYESMFKSGTQLLLDQSSFIINRTLISPHLLPVLCHILTFTCLD
jgi:hypothetical protein